MEDVLEELLQEEIFDENDQMEKQAKRIALWVGRRWKRRRNHGTRSMASVVLQASAVTSESSSLLGTSENSQEHSKRDTSLLGSMFQKFGI